MVDHVVQDLYVRTTYQNALVARRQIEKGKANGRLCAVRFRAWLQTCLDRLGRSIHRQTHVYILPLLLGLGVLLAGFKAFERNTEFDQLWVMSGGRLETELHYTKLALGETESVTHLLVTQTAKQGISLEVPQQRLLHRKALLAHLNLLKTALHVSVNLFDASWSFKDICLTASPPNFEVQYIDIIFENIMPCQIITPLDCFWEGSKLLGPENPITVPNLGNSIKWSNLNPQSIMKYIKNQQSPANSNFPFNMLENYMKRAGINSGYQEKPCLDPEDPDCPETAPNKKSKKIPDIGAELANGCRGFASKYMHWPKELMLGGFTVNKTGYIQKAEAIQSVVQLLGEKELYESWSQSYKVMHFSWDQQKAALVLKTWQKKFTEEIKKLIASPVPAPYNFHTFSTMLLGDLLTRYNFLDSISLSAGILLMAMFVCFMELNIFNPLRSTLTLGLFSFLLLILSMASGMAFSCLVGLQIHSAFVAILISIVLSLGVNNLSLLLFSYKRVSSHGFDFMTQKYTVEVGKMQVGMVLKACGSSILMSNLSAIAIFMAAAIIPVPALRAFCFQVSISVTLVLVTSLFGITSLISFDVRRMRSGRIDIFCCFPSKNFRWPFFKNLTSFGTASTIDDQMRQLNGNQDSKYNTLPSANLLMKDLKNPSSPDEELPIAIKPRTCYRMPRDIGQRYFQYLTTGPCRIRVILLCIMVFCFSVWGITRIQAGLTLPEMAPNGSNEQEFLKTYGQMFGFYNMYAVTRGDFEYPTNQKLLYEYHDAFMRVPNVLKNDNGGLPQMWLTLFREWLLGLQKAFDKDWARACLNLEGWDTCASENGILAYKLLVQTGNTDNPIDKSLVLNARLVNENGIINEETFYNLLTAWVSNDIMAYGASQANIRPEPRHWTHVANDYDLQIAKSLPITYAQMPFYANNLYETSIITKFILTVRSICKHFDERGLPNYPSGIPFVYWEQYQELHQYFFVAVLVALLLLFIICALFLCNAQAALITLLMSVLLIVQILGFMGFANIKFSAIPVVLLIGTVATGTFFTVYLCLSFVTSIGDKNRRTQLSVDHISKTVLQSAATICIGVLTLIFQNNYVSRSYFLIIIAETVFGLFNGLVCLPVFLAMFGPPPEIIPLKHPDRISTPSPVRVRKRSRHVSMRKLAPPPPSNRNQQHHYPQQNSSRHHQQQPGTPRLPKSSRAHRYVPRSDGSLSTIPEESGSYHSGSLNNMETRSQVSLSRSPSPSIHSEYTSDSGSDSDDSKQTQSSGSSKAPRCVLRAKFELELDGNMMSAAAQPCVHKSSSKHHHSRQPKRHKRHHNTRY